MIMNRAVLNGFVVLAVVTFTTVQCTQEVEGTTVKPLESTSTDEVTTTDADLTVIPIQPDKGLLVGEDTPVWIAYRPDPNKPVNYTRLQKGIIKEAIDSLTYKTKRSINEKPDYVSANAQEVLHSLDEVSSDEESSESSEPTPKVVETSFLVVMDYRVTWPSIESDQMKYIKDKILYALAFFNGFNLRLRHVKSPKVRLRIAGIVIGRNKEATPYIRENERPETGLNVRSAKEQMNAYWRNLSTYHPDFPSDSYHSVATLTDSEPKEHGSSYWQYFWESYGNGLVALDFLFLDDLIFRSLPTNGLKNTLSIGYVIQYSGREIRLASYEHLSPGTTIENVILPGELMPATKQCEVHGYDADAIICEASTGDLPCEHLRCSNTWLWSRCGDIGSHLLGTACSKYGDICLDGKCVAKPLLYV